MKLNKVQFINCINRYKLMRQQEEEIINSLNIDPEWKPSEWINSYYDFLEEMCELEEDPTYGTILDWWVFETDFGRGSYWIEPIITEGETSIELRDAGALYDYLTQVEIANK